MRTFKKGDRVVIKWPEQSAWHDTMDGIRGGSIEMGRVYTLLNVHADRSHDCVSAELDVGWSLDVRALDHYPSVVKRKLPA